MAIMQWRLLRDAEPDPMNVQPAAGKKKALMGRAPPAKKNAAPTKKAPLSASLLGRKSLNRRTGRRPAAQPSEALVSKLAAAASADAQPCMRVQLARSMASIYAPTDYKLLPDAGLGPSRALRLAYTYGYNGAKCRDSIHLTE